jgi:hypothetical protein
MVMVAAFVLAIGGGPATAADRCYAANGEQHEGMRVPAAA